MLYNSGETRLTGPRPQSPQEQARIAGDHYNYWFPQATDFFETFEFHYAAQKWNLAAFDLHQAAESAYKAILLVFTNYFPKEHYLHILGGQAVKQIPDLINIFPQATQQQTVRFDALNYAYIGARYDPDFRISQEDLDYLAERVRMLLNRAAAACTEKLRQIAEG